MPIVCAKKTAHTLKQRFVLGARWLWCSVLVIIALIQGGYLLVRVAPLRFALSQKKLSSLHEHLAELGISYQAKGTYFDLSGVIILEKPSLSSVKIGGPALSCQSLEMRLSLWNLFHGKIVANEILCIGGQINLPLQNYRTNESTLCAQKVYFLAEHHNQSWSFKHFNAEIFNLSILAAGPIPFDIDAQLRLSSTNHSPQSISKAQKHPFTLEERLGNILAHIEKVKEFLAHCENPSITILSQYDHHGALELRIRGFAEQINSPELQLENVVILSRLKNTAEGSFFDQKPVLMAEKFSIRDMVKGQWAYAKSSVELFNFYNLAQQRVDWSAHNLKTPRGTISYAFGNIQSKEPALIIGRVCAVQGALWLNLTGSMNPEAQSGQFLFEGQLELDEIKHWITEFPWESWPAFKSSKAPSVRGIAAFDRNWHPTYCSFQGICPDGYILDKPIQYASMQGYFQKDSLHLSHFCIQSPQGWKTTGSYEHSFRKNQSRFSLHGSIDPNFLTPWLPEWWGPIWDDFAFQTPNWPKANLDVWVPWDRLQGFSLFGRAECNRFELRKVNIPQANVLLYCTYNLVSLNPICIHTSKSSGSGGLFLRFDDDHSGPVQTAIAFDAYLPLEFASIIPQAKPIVSLFTADHPLHMELYANQWIKEMPEALNNAFDLEIGAPFTLLFNGIKLDSLKLDAHQVGSNIVVDPVLVGFASGQAQGSVIAHVMQTEPSLDIQFTLIGAKRDQVLANVGYLNSFQRPFSIEGTSSSIAGAGILNGDFTGSVTIPNWPSFQGQGHLHLTEADLGSIHFFGGLSRFLETLYIPIGTLTLNEAESSFLLRNQTLTFPDGEIVGPTARITAQGNFYIPDQSLDFQVKIYPLGQVPVLSTAMIIFRPLSKAFQLQLNGTVENPVWQFSYLSAKTENFR